MARVYERPRYAYQARNRLLSMAIGANNFDTRMAVAATLKADHETRETMWLDYEYLAELALEGETEDLLANEDVINLDVPTAEYLLDAEIGRLVGTHILSQEESCRKLLSDYLTVFAEEQPTKCLTDEKAMFWLMSMALDASSHHVQSKQAAKARVAATDLIKLQLASQKVSPAQFMQTYSTTQMFKSASVEALRDEEWVAAAENMVYRSQPMWVKYCRLWCNPPRRMRERVEEMVEKVDKSKASDRHRFFPLDQVVKEYSAYNYAGVIVMYVDKVMLVFDNSSADYLRTALTAIRNSRVAFSMLRVCGDTDRTNYLVEFRKCVAWISRAIKSSTGAREVARHMHLAYTAWQNEVGESEAEVGVGWETRVDPLMADMRKYHPRNDTWWNLVKSFDCPERVRGEFLKLYHALPPPDIDALLLHDTMEEKTQGANVANKDATEQFIKFCKAYDFCRFLAKNRRAPARMASEGYKYEDTSWYKASIRGKLKLPPKAEWGCVWISREFEYPHTGDFHVLDAKDSTRVIADLDAYMNRSKSRSMPRVENNELLSALFNGEVLSNGEDMRTWRNRVFNKGVTREDDVIGAIAGKAENTKPGEKTRETLSSCDTIREYFSEVDHAIRPLAEMTPGVSIRVNMVKHKKKFQSMARAVSKRSTGYAFATSTDVSAWSPKMDRNLFHSWQEYALSTTECTNPTGQVALWDKLVMFTDRRGVKRWFECDKGNIQGWPATSDTTMHAHILIMWAYELREREILSAKEAAYTLCLIDDAATVVALEGSKEECVKKASDAKELLRTMYLELGFEMDVVKSFFSSIKFTYLNELYVDGTQVGHGAKTLMKIDRDHTRRFGSIQDNIATAFGTAASAASQGADPFVAYWIAAKMSYEWLFAKHPQAMDLGMLPLFLMSLAPVGLNGLGIRAITSVFASGENDHLTWFFEIAGGAASIFGSEIDRNIFNAIMCQPLRTPTALSTFKTPFAISAASHSTASAAIARRFRESARDAGLAEPFSSLDAIEEDEEFVSSLDSVLKSGVHEAALLEEVSSCMPMALIEQVMARIDKTEIVAYLLGGKGIGSLRRRVQNADAFNLHTITSLCQVMSKSHIDWLSIYETDGSFQAAYQMRSMMYNDSEYSVINHTYPCPFSLWAFEGDVDLDTERARRVTTTSFSMGRLNKTAASRTKNMYDSAVDQIGYRGYITARSDAAREAKVALSDPVRRMVAAGVAAFRWAEFAGVHYQGLYELFMRSWSGKHDERMTLLPGARMLGSVKRLSLRHTKVGHLVYPFQNVQSAARVDARPITVAQADTEHMYDVMGAITTLRSATLLEAALRVRAGEPDFAYAFGYKASSAARLFRPDRAEKLSHVSKKIKAFVDINTSMRESAIVVTNYDSMSKLAAVYEASGEKAARSLFENLVSNEVMGESLVSAAIAPQLSIRVEDQVAEPLKKSWVLRDYKSRQKSYGAVTELGHASSSMVSIEMPLGTVDDQLHRIGEAWADTMLLDLVSRDARFCTDLMRLSNSGTIGECVNLQDWATKSSSLIPQVPVLRKVIHEVESIFPNQDPVPHLSTVYRHFGANGFRHRGSEGKGDPLHMSESFFGTTSSILGVASRVGKGMNHLRHSTSEGYASVITSGTSNNRRTVSRVIKAKWLAAAARRDIKAGEVARRERSGMNATLPNYEATFLRLAAQTLRANGDFDMARFCSDAVTRTISSLTTHLSSSDKAESFEDKLEQIGFDPEGTANTVTTAEMSIAAVCNVAAELDLTVDTNSVIKAFRNMATWAETDVSGTHGTTPVRERRMTTFLSSTGMLSLPQGNNTNEEIVVPVSQKIEMGDEFGTEGGLSDAAPQDLYQWICTDPSMKERSLEILSADNIKAAYLKAIESEEMWDYFCGQMATEFDLSTYEDPGFSIFDRPSWRKSWSDGSASEGDEVVAE